jgi:hypothetical protein
LNCYFVNCKEVEKVGRLDWRPQTMCDVKKYSDIYKEIKKLTPDDTLQLILESETDEEKEFYETIGNFLLRIGQREVIARNVF